MNAAQRDAIRDAARYLRQIRPIDPVEVTEYVDGELDPAAVRAVLRDQAADLEVLERADGTFVPVGAGTIAPLEAPVSALPERYAAVIEQRLVDRFGEDWATGDAGDELRDAVRQLKEDYYRQRSVAYGPTAALGYAVYHLADYYAASQYVHSELAHRGLLGRSLRVLDVGAGVGGPAIGLFDLAGPETLIDYRAIEPSPAAEVLAGLLEATGPNVHWAIDRTTAEAFEPAERYDLVVFANVLSELSEPTAVLERYRDAVDPDGTVVLLAPADKATATELRRVERSVCETTDLQVYAPTVSLRGGGRPADRCWSFDVRPDLAVPAFQRALDEPAGATGEFVNADVQFAYSLLRADGRRLLEWRPDPDRYAPLESSDQHVTDRIDVAAVKLSHDLSDGEHPVILIGDGSQTVDHFAVLTRPTELNEALLDAAYGDGLAFDGGLLLWNEDERAYNLVVDAETVVEAVPARDDGA